MNSEVSSEEGAEVAAVEDESTTKLAGEADGQLPPEGPAIQLDQLKTELKKSEAAVAWQKMKVQQLEARIAEFQTKFAEAREYVKKMEGEIEQIRARFQRDTQKTVDQKLGQAYQALLPVLDNFELMAKSASNETGSLAEATRMIVMQFAAFLKEAELNRIETKGLAFNPEVHEAITSVLVSDPAADGVIVDEVKAGYRHKDAVLRPAQVVVGKCAKDGE